MKWAVAILFACAGLRAAQDARVSGEVRDFLGDQLHDVSIILTPEAGGGMQEARSDEHGGFFFSNVPPGSYQIRIVLQGFVNAHIRFSLAAGEQRILAPLSLGVSSCGRGLFNPQYLTPLAPGLQTGEVSGVITADHPRPGAQVTLCPKEGPCRTTSTDSGGGFRLEELTAGIYTAKVTLDGLQPATSLMIVDREWEAVYFITLVRRAEIALCE